MTTHTGTLLSSRFKNLMPCYTVTYAEATTDKKAALDLSKSLKAIGVDNYVKNTGAWVGPSQAIDAYCASPEDAGGDVQVAAFAGGSLWIPVQGTDADLQAALNGAPEPTAMNESFDAWIQPASATPEALKGAKYRAVDARTGKAGTCSVARAAVLTLGVPHFGVLQQEDKPKAPACGDAALYAELSCDVPVEDGSWVVVPEGTALAAYTPVDGGAALQAQAETALNAATDLEITPDPAEWSGMDITRTVTVTKWKGPAGEVALVEGTREIGSGICGGESTSWVGVYAVAGDSLGALLGELLQTGPNTPVGVVDVGGDGRPEMVIQDFPNTTTVYEGPSTRGSLDLAYCDCPC